MHVSLRDAKTRTGKICVGDVKIDIYEKDFEATSEAGLIAGKYVKQMFRGLFLKN